MKLDELATLISGHADGERGLDLAFSSDKWPPALILPPDGVKLVKLEGFVAKVLSEGLGYAGIDGSLKDFFKLMPTIQGVYLTRFEVDLDGSGRNAFLVGFQLRESWNIISDSGLPNIPALVISNPGFTIGSLGCDAGYMVDVYGTLEIFGAAVQVMVQWPAMIITGTLVREFDLQKLLAEACFTEQVNFGDEAASLKIRAMMLRMDLNNKAFDFTFGMSGWQILPDDKLTLNNLLLDLSTSQGHRSAAIRAQMTVCDTGIDLSGTFQDGQTVFSGSTCPGQKILIGELINDLAEKFSADTLELPTALQNLVIENLSVSFNTERKDFKFTCEASSGNLSSKFDIGIEHDGESNQMKLGGEFKVELNDKQSLNFSLEYERKEDKKKKTQAFVASYHPKEKQSLCISALVAELTPDDTVLETIIRPLNVAIDLKSVLFVYYKEFSTEPNKTSEPAKFLFGVTLDVGASVDLSGLPLGELPSIAVEDLQILIASQPFEASHVEAVNSLLPERVSKLPAKAKPTESEKPGFEDSTSPEEKSSDSDSNVEKPEEKTPPVLAKGINLSALLKLGEGEPTPLVLSPSDGEAPAEEQKETPSTVKSILPAGDGQALETTTPSVKWIKIQKSFGPVRFERIGFQFQSQDQVIWFLLDASLSAAGLTVSLDGLGFGSSITRFEPQFDLHGLGIDYRNGPLQIGGAFLKQEFTKDGTKYTAFGGLAVIRTETLSISAIGSYANLNGDPSLFIYAVLDYPLGGPPFFFVTGLAAGFGYNRKLTLPSIDNIATFPLVEEATREGGPPQLPTGQEAQQDTLTAELTKLENYIPAAVGQNFLAVGVKFTSFKMIDSFALLAVSFGERLRVDLLGLSKITIPFSDAKDQPCLAEVEIAFKASFIPDQGFLGVIAGLTSSSYILSKDCHLTGGMAFYSWFSGDHAGDFVLTVGGYHSLFNVPEHYPLVPRLAIDWQVDRHLSIKGDGYFALTPSALMAGGHLEANWHSGPLKAWFKAGADFLIAWKPFHYDAQIYVNMGVSYTFWFFGTRHITVDVGADLHIWGPEFSGRAHIHLWCVSFSVSFGSSSQVTPQIGWGEFRSSFLPNDILSVSVKNGLVLESKSSEKPADNSRKELGFENGSSEQEARIINLGVINPKDFSLIVDSVIPTRKLNGQVATYQDDKGNTVEGTSFGIAPMKNSELETNLKIEVTEGPCTDFKFTSITKNVPAGLWGTDFQPGLNSEPLVNNVISGFEITPARAAEPGKTAAIDASKLQYTPGEPQKLTLHWTKDILFSTDRPVAEPG